MNNTNNSLSPSPQHQQQQQDALVNQESNGINNLSQFEELKKLTQEHIVKIASQEGLANVGSQGAVAYGGAGFSQQQQQQQVEEKTTIAINVVSSDANGTESVEKKERVGQKRKSSQGKMSSQCISVNSRKSSVSKKRQKISEDSFNSLTNLTQPHSQKNEAKPEETSKQAVVEDSTEIYEKLGLGFVTSQKEKRVSNKRVSNKDEIQNPDQTQIARPNDYQSGMEKLGILRRSARVQDRIQKLKGNTLLLTQDKLQLIVDQKPYMPEPSKTRKLVKRIIGRRKIQPLVQDEKDQNNDACEDHLKIKNQLNLTSSIEEITGKSSIQQIDQKDFIQKEITKRKSKDSRSNSSQIRQSAGLESIDRQENRSEQDIDDDLKQEKVYHEVITEESISIDHTRSPSPTSNLINKQQPFLISAQSVTKFDDCNLITISPQAMIPQIDEGPNSEYFPPPLYERLFETYRFMILPCEGNNSRLQTLTKNYAHRHNLNNITKSALRELQSQVFNVLYKVLTDIVIQSKTRAQQGMSLAAMVPSSAPGSSGVFFNPQTSLPYQPKDLIDSKTGSLLSQVTCMDNPYLALAQIQSIESLVTQQYVQNTQTRKDEELQEEQQQSVKEEEQRQMWRKQFKESMINADVNQYGLDFDDINAPKKKSWRREKLQKEFMKQVDEQIILDRLDKENEKAMQAMEYHSFHDIYHGLQMEHQMNQFFLNSQMVSAQLFEIDPQQLPYPPQQIHLHQYGRPFKSDSSTKITFYQVIVYLQLQRSRNTTIGRLSDLILQQVQNMISF